MVGGRNNSSRGGRSGRRGRGGRFTPNHYNNNNYGYGQSPFPFQGGMPYVQPGYVFGQGGMPYGTSPGYYGPSSYAQPPFNGAGFNPGQTPNAEAAPAAAAGGNQGDDGFTSPSKKETIPLSALRGTPTPPPKKQIRWNNQFEILEEEDNGGEVKEEENNDEKGTEGKKNAAKKKSKGKKKGIMEKTSDDVAAIAEEIENEKASKNKGGGKVVNSFNQSTNRLATPTAQQSKVYLKLREKITNGQPIKIDDLEELKGVHQVSVLANTLTQKHWEYARDKGEEFDSDKCFDRLKYTNKTNLIKGLNNPVTTENLHEVLKGHAWISLDQSVPTDFPQLIGNDLAAILEDADPDPELVQKGCELLLKRVYMNDEDRADDFLNKLDVDDLLRLASSKGELTKTFRLEFSVNASLPYRIDLEKFPDPLTPGWAGKRNTDRSKKASEHPNPNPPAQSQENDKMEESTQQPPETEQGKDAIEPPSQNEEKPSECKMEVDGELKSPEENKFKAPEANDAQMDDLPPPTKPLARPTTPIPTEFGKGNFKSKSISQWRMIIQTKKETAEVWKKGNTSNPTLIAAQIISYLLALGDNYKHHLRILPFDSSLIATDDIKPLTSADNVMALPQEKLHKYVGTLHRPKELNGAWRSFEIKISTSIANPQHFFKTPVMFDGESNLLMSLLDDQQITILNGTKWNNNSYPLWGIAGSDEADDPVAIKEELQRRIIKLTESPCVEFEVEWQEVSNSAWGEEVIVAPGYYIMGTLITEDQLEYIFTRLKIDESFPVTGKIRFFKARGCSKNYDSLRNIRSNLVGQSNYASNRVSFSINGTSPEVLAMIPNDPPTPHNTPNRKSVRELILEMKTGTGPQVIDKVGASASNNQILIIGDKSNASALKTLASEVLRKIRLWSSNQNATLDITNITASERESKAVKPVFQPGMTIYTPQAMPPAPSSHNSTPKNQVARPNVNTDHPRSDEVIELSKQLEELKREISEMRKEMQSNHPANVSTSTEVTDAISSLTDKVETFAEEVRKERCNVTAGDSRATALATTSIDDLIIRSHIFDSQIVNFPEIARDDVIHLPPHGSCDKLPPPHSHPKEEEDRMNRLSRMQIVALIQASPNHVDHSADTFCLKCIEHENKEIDLEFQCDVCHGQFHADCQDIVDYEFENEDPLHACYTCRTIRTSELTVHYIKKCPTCSGWVAEKKQQIAEMAIEHQRNLRLKNHILLRENHSARNVQEMLEGFQAAIDEVQNQHHEDEIDFNNDAGMDEEAEDAVAEEVQEPSPKRAHTPPQTTKFIPAKASTAASQKGAISGEERDQYLHQVQLYKADVYRSYRDTPPDESVFELAIDWMSDRDKAIEKGVADFEEALHENRLQMLRDDSELANSNNCLTEKDRETAKCLRRCHSLFWATESGKQFTSICPFSSTNRAWLESTDIAMMVPDCECDNGYYLDTVDMIFHLHNDHAHWFASVAAYTLMCHDIIVSMYDNQGTPLSRSERPSPQHSRKLFSSAQPARAGQLKIEGLPNERQRADDHSSADSPSNRLERQVLAGIPEEEMTSVSDSAKKKRSDSESTTSASKRHKLAQSSRIQLQSERRTSSRLRDQQRERMLNRTDDGNSSVTSELSLDPA